MNRFKIILMGSGSLACPLLDGLLASTQDTLLAVVTQPDRMSGRHLQCRPCVVKQHAQSCGVRVFSPEDASEESFVEELSALAPDVIVVASYGQFLKRNLLAAPRLGVINVHPSLLPKYRGASPIQWALANGETTTGVSVLYVTPKMDAGDILAQESHPIDPDDTFCTLEPKLAALGMELLARVLNKFRNGQTEGRPQDESQVTFARKLTKADACVDWQLPAATIRNRLRGFCPWPGAHTTLPDGLLLKLHAVEVTPAPDVAPPGMVIDVGPAGPVVATGADALRLLSVQPAGKKMMGGGDFLRGYPLTTGARLGLQ